MENAELISCELVEEKKVEPEEGVQKELVLADVSRPYVEKLSRYIPLGDASGKSIALSTLRVVLPLTPDWVADMPYAPLQVDGYYVLVALLAITEPGIKEEFESDLLRFFGSPKSFNFFQTILMQLKRLGILTELWYIQNRDGDNTKTEQGIDELFTHLNFKSCNPDLTEAEVLKELRSESKKTCVVLTSIGRYLVHTSYPNKDELSLVRDVIGEGREWRYSFRGPMAFMKEGVAYRIFG